MRKKTLKTYALLEEDAQVCLECLDIYVALQARLYACELIPRSAVPRFIAKVSNIRAQMWKNKLRRTSVTFLRKVIRCRIDELNAIKSWPGAVLEEKIETLGSIVARIDNLLADKE